MDNSACMAMARVAQAIVYNNCKPLPRKSEVHYCAGYSGKMAYAFVNGKYGGGGYGDMGKPSYYSGIQNIGYTMVEHEPSISVSELAKKLAAHTNWFAGSIACYQALDGSGSQRDYGHAQFYLGDGAWTCDVVDNYGTSFVYSNRNSQIYDFRLFKPNNEPAVCVEGNYCLPEPTDVTDKSTVVDKVIRWSVGAIGKQRSSTEVTANAFVSASQQYNVDLPLMLAAAHIESHFGTDGKRPKETKSIFSVGLYDNNHNAKYYDHMDDSVVDYAKLLKMDYLSNKTLDALLQPGGFVNTNGQRYATDRNYESKISKTRNNIINRFFKN